MRATDRRADDAAFEVFVAARSADLLRTAVLLTRDRGHAEDLLQTALVKGSSRSTVVLVGATVPGRRRPPR